MGSGFHLPRMRRISHVKIMSQGLLRQSTNGILPLEIMSKFEATTA